MFSNIKSWLVCAFIVLFTALSFWISSSAEALELNNENLSVQDGSGKPIAVVGNKAALRLGTSGEVGRLYLFPSSSQNIFDEGQATITMSANGSSMSLKGGDSYVFVDGEDRNGRSQLTLLNGTIYLKGSNGSSAIKVNDNGGICIGNC